MKVYQVVSTKGQIKFIPKINSKKLPPIDFLTDDISETLFFNRVTASYLAMKLSGLYPNNQNIPGNRFHAKEVTKDEVDDLWLVFSSRVDTKCDRMILPFRHFPIGTKAEVVMGWIQDLYDDNETLIETGQE